MKEKKVIEGKKRVIVDNIYIGVKRGRIIEMVGERG